MVVQVRLLGVSTNRTENQRAASVIPRHVFGVGHSLYVTELTVVNIFVVSLALQRYASGESRRLNAVGERIARRWECSGGGVGGRVGGSVGEPAVGQERGEVVVGRVVA